MEPGVYNAVKKNGTKYFRASITYRGKHVSLGSYENEGDAGKAYLLAGEVLSPSSAWNIKDYPADCILPFEKWVVLINFRDNKIYFKNPIYLKKRYFHYYIGKNASLTFDVDDLFYYAHHKILKRGGHLFVSDYGMQINILTRYGIKSYAVPGRDYLFSSGDTADYRYANIEIVNHFHGVTKLIKKGICVYLAKIHINGDFIIGKYITEEEAAIAFNKAADILSNKGLVKNFPRNYLEGIDEIAYASMYQKIRISKKIINMLTMF